MTAFSHEGKAASTASLRAVRGEQSNFPALVFDQPGEPRREGVVLAVERGLNMVAEQLPSSAVAPPRTGPGIGCSGSALCHRVQASAGRLRFRSSSR